MKRVIVSATAVALAIAVANLSAMVPEQVTIDTGTVAGVTGTV
jgi:hypothetical protein